MSAYKVPQDVEAEDKLLGPFSFRQFIYLMIAAGLIGLGYALSIILLPLALIPTPFVIILLALALPLKKDQPMETYLLALVSFYFLKPRKRLWQPDGITSLVEITAPKEIEPERAKSISAEEARDKLGFLTDIIDSRGWAVRGTGVPSEGVTSMHQSSYQEAQQANDMLDSDNAAAQKFDKLISNQKEVHMSNLRNSMQVAAMESEQQYTAMTAPHQNQFNPNQYNPPMQSFDHSYGQLNRSPAEPSVDMSYSLQNQANNSLGGDRAIAIPSYNPYPENIKQSIIHPLENFTPMTSPFEPQPANVSTSISEQSPDIMKLVNETDGLTVASVAREAKRIEDQQNTLSDKNDGEVRISLR